MSQINYSTYLNLTKQAKNSEEGNKSSKISFFTLKNDGDSAIVRFQFDTTDSLEVFCTHGVYINNKFTKINCLRTPLEPLSKCPLCEAGTAVSYKILLKLVEYTRTEKNSVISGNKDANGVYIPQGKIWERTEHFAQLLYSYIEEYGDLSDLLFKITRRGEAGSLKTTYDITLANPKIYKDEFFPKDFSMFENVHPEKFVFKDKTYEEMINLINATESEKTREAQKEEQKDTKQASVEPTRYSNPTTTSSYTNSPRTAPVETDYTKPQRFQQETSTSNNPSQMNTQQSQFYSNNTSTMGERENTFKRSSSQSSEANSHTPDNNPAESYTYRPRRYGNY